MAQGFSEEVINMANGMGIALYQRFSTSSAALFLRCHKDEVLALQKKHKISYVQLSKAETMFFGYQLVEYLISQTKSARVSETNSCYDDQIIRIDEVVKLTSLSRSSIWRLEQKGEFPARVKLSSSRVGWIRSTVTDWLNSR